MHTADKHFDRRIGRTLMLVDADNVARNTRDDAEFTGLVEHAIDLARLERDDHVIVGCDAHAAFTALDASKRALGHQPRLVTGRGPDGADYALLDAFRDEGAAAGVALRYDRVVIASGDHAFAPIAYALRNERVVVWVVSHVNALALDLRRAAHVVKPLDHYAIAA